MCQDFIESVKHTSSIISRMHKHKKREMLAALRDLSEHRSLLGLCYKLCFIQLKIVFSYCLKFNHPRVICKVDLTEWTAQVPHVTHKRSTNMVIKQHIVELTVQ